MNRLEQVYYSELWGNLVGICEMKLCQLFPILRNWKGRGLLNFVLAWMLLTDWVTWAIPLHHRAFLSGFLSLPKKKKKKKG